MRESFNRYTREITRADLERLLTRETPEAYHYFARELDHGALAALPWYRRWPRFAKQFFMAFAMRLSPARRALYGVAVAAAVIGAIELFRGAGIARALVGPFEVGFVTPAWADGTGWLLMAFLLLNLLVMMEVADRLSLKNELEIARDIQLAMLPAGTWSDGRAAAAGITRPANTVGGDFYDILPLGDGRLLIALGDVAGKGSPAALLMALLLAMMRTLADEGLEPAALMRRLNVQIFRHSPRSRFITIFFGAYDPATGRLEWVNAGHLPPMIRRASGAIDRDVFRAGGSLALGMFEEAEYESGAATLDPGDAIVLYSDGLTEAEDARGVPFEDAGVEAVISRHGVEDPASLGRALLLAVETYAGDARLADDLTVLTLVRRHPDASGV
ncbi:MAG: PP2C family protein-serine/threonine phosphatase [Acidobacteriota bacterium]|nr:PP2C family protein-serine/threonine phosphatase [Acidobacteriota bacterium]